MRDPRKSIRRGVTLRCNLRRVETLESQVEELDYEPPPHVFARIGAGVLRSGRAVFAGRIPWCRSRWRRSWVGLVVFEALLYLNLAPVLLRHLPFQFRADAQWLWWRNFRLTQAMGHDRDAFLRLALFDGAWTALVAPFYEELLFRGVPILLARSLERIFRPIEGRTAVVAIALASTLLFAWMHHRVVEALPMPQLLFGTLAWFSAWRWGLRYSILLHVLVNLLLFGGFLFRLYASSG